ncbi:MAG: triose-phosphate isomerase [Holosporales bacterium]|nr:triose-phosphate isomerase [Holosporales bacterium]
MQKILIANWKMNGSKDLVDGYADALRGTTSDYGVVCCPPVTVIDYAYGQLPSFVSLGAQDCSKFDSGAQTGEVCCSMLREIGCSHVIVGHSERRRSQNENDAVVQGKAEIVQKYGMTPIVCIGESLDEYRNRETLQVLERQLGYLAQASKGHLIVAYEPVWAIGTGETPSIEEISKVHRFIKEKSGATTVYGGSVTLDNYKSIIALNEVDGVLVGGESLKIDRFSSMLRGL